MTPTPTAEDTTRDFELQGACPLCEGNLALRLGPEGARSVCRGCGCWSRPRVHQGSDGLRLFHPPVGLA
jgi:hypothetical protein